MRVGLARSLAPVMLVLVALAGSSAAQEGPQPPAVPAAAAPAAPSRAEIDAALDRATRWLSARVSAVPLDRLRPREVEAALFATLTLAQTGALATDPAGRARALALLYGYPLASIHGAAVTVLALERLGGRAHADRIADAVRVLVEGQSLAEGGWAYQGARLEAPPPVRAVPSATADPRPATPSAVIRVERAGEGWEQDRRDNTNSVFALLALRSAARSGVVAGADTWKRALSFFADGQAPDGGWGGHFKDPASYGGMTCDGVCGLALALEAAGVAAPAADPRVQRGLEWLAVHFALERNPFPAGRRGKHDHHFYYLCALERAGTLLGVPRIGAHDWYAEGARYLLSTQREDGSFFAPEDTAANEMEDTCFAMLFLERASAAWSGR